MWLQVNRALAEALGEGSEATEHIKQNVCVAITALVELTMGDYAWKAAALPGWATPARIVVRHRRFPIRPSKGNNSI